MRSLMVLLLLLIISNPLLAQIKKHSIQLSSGYSSHGTGDMAGLAMNISYNGILFKRIDLENGIMNTIHWKKDRGFVSSTPSENLIRFTTAGIQYNSLLHYKVLNLSKHKFRIGAGILARFQSSSYPDSYGIYNEPNLFPQTFYSFNSTSNYNTLSAGYSFGLSYIAAICKNYHLGIKAFFQNDTNSDAITYISLIIGRDFGAAK